LTDGDKNREGGGKVSMAWNQEHCDGFGSLWNLWRGGWIFPTGL